MRTLVNRTAGTGPASRDSALRLRQRSKLPFDRAAVEGERIQVTNPPAQDRDFHYLDETVGDAYENLALWHLEHSKDAAAAMNSL